MHAHAGAPAGRRRLASARVYYLLRAALARRSAAPGGEIIFLRRSLTAFVGAHGCRHSWLPQARCRRPRRSLRASRPVSSPSSGWAVWRRDLSHRLRRQPRPGRQTSLSSPTRREARRCAAPCRLPAALRLSRCAEAAARPQRTCSTLTLIWRCVGTLPVAGAPHPRGRPLTPSAGAQKRGVPDVTRGAGPAAQAVRATFSTLPTYLLIRTADTFSYLQAQG